MAKRSATSALTQDNWDKEDEPEEEGVFQKASSDVLKSRVIKMAKRRTLASDSDSESKPSPFSGFAGFGKTTSTSNIGSPFSFLSQNKLKADATDKNGTNLQENKFGIKDPPMQFKSFSNSSTLTQKDSIFSSSSFQTQKESTAAESTFKPFEHIFKSSDSEKKSDNLESLKELNLSCSKWIAEHLEKNPYCILTPIFKDYEKHLSELNVTPQAENKDKKDESEAVSSPDNFSKETNKTLSFNKKESTESNQEKELIKDKEIPKPFQFGSFAATTTTTTTSATASSTKPFSLQFGDINTTFGGCPPPFKIHHLPISKSLGDEIDSKKDDEESSEPPKNEFTPVVEEDSIFDIKCKIFVKKEDSFVSRGVGTLFLKPVKDSKKTQVVVRAHTNLGNILLNILLSPGMPIQKTGKNNAMIVCIPTPESEPPPVPVLIRVKTSEECDVLIKKLEECKGT